MNCNAKNVLVTGANGQLGRTIQDFEPVEGIDFVFKTKDDLDITNKEALKELFVGNNFDFCINCAAYTNVEQAEQTPEIAYKINAEGVKNIAEVCKATDTVLIHISTDYVFDGTKTTPYTEEDTPNPINEYGKSKLKGEEYVQQILEKYYIIRTSWLYSKKYGDNFYRTILEKARKGEKLTITNSETGTPTNANDLSEFLIKLILAKDLHYGIYNFSNSGKATWYDFAREIVLLLGKENEIAVEATNSYPTFAKRPMYSVLSKNKFVNKTYANVIKWNHSLTNCN